MGSELSFLEIILFPVIVFLQFSVGLLFNLYDFLGFEVLNIPMPM